MTAPRLGQGMPTDDSWIARQLADLQRQITELRAGGAIYPAIASAQTGGFTLDLAASAVCSATVQVPSGFTQALVLAVGAVMARNTRATTDSLNMYVDINALGTSSLLWDYMQPGDQLTLTRASSALLTNLGSSFSIIVWASTDGPWTDTAGNDATLDATILFLR